MGLRVLAHFGLKNKTRKIVNIQENFEPQQVFMYNFLSQNILVFQIYILFTKIIETMWSGDISSMQGIRNFFNYIKSLCAKLF